MAAPQHAQPRARALRCATAALLLATAAMAHDAPLTPPTFAIRLNNHLFEPTEIDIPAHTQVLLKIENLDAAPEEFASWEFNRKKLIPGNHTAILYVGPLAPGSYPFFGTFNPKTALGQLRVQ